MQDVVDVADDAQQPRSDEHSGGQVAHHRAHAKAFEQWNGDDRRRQKNNRFQDPGLTHLPLVSDRLSMRPVDV